MRITRKAGTTVMSAAFIAAALTFGGGVAEAAPKAQPCSIAPESAWSTAEGYYLNNIRATYRTDAPPTNSFALYTLSAEPQNCADGEYFLFDVKAESATPLMNGKISTTDWRQVAFSVPSGRSFVEVRYGDPDRPYEADYLASVSRLLP